jgi:regulatory protein
MPARRRARAVEERRLANAEIDDPSLVLAAALRFLEARPRSTAEVRRRLLTHGYRADLVEGCVERLLDLGILDDAAFARTWVESRDRARPRGERALRSELARKGIDRGLADGVLEEREIDRPEADAEAARRVLARHARTLAREADPRARRNRAYALLARNGFDSEIAIAAINAFGDQEAEAPGSG